MSVSEDDKSTRSSLDGSVTDNNSKHSIGVARLQTLKAPLADAARANTIIQGVSHVKSVVMSPHIHHMLDAYITANTGKVIVVCSPGNFGKSTAAQFLMRGKHPNRPDRSLMISACAMEDFETEFSLNQLGMEKAVPNLGQVICDALSSPASEGRPTQFVGKVVNAVPCTLQQQRGAEISVYGTNRIPSGPPDFKCTPLLIIDHSNESSEKNSFHSEIAPGRCQTTRIRLYPDDKRELGNRAGKAE